MGKKANQKVLAAKSASVTTSAGKADSKPTTEEKKPSIMDSVEVLLHDLESLVSNHPTGKHEEKERILQQLLHEYKLISVKNKVDSKREELLTQETLELERKNDETQQEVNDLRENYSNAEAKISKLENLSQVLNFRIKSVESKAAEDIKAEKADRLKMSYDFSEKIKDISNKLDILGKKREQIITENQRLKQVLKQCLDDYDHERQAEKEAQARMVKELGEVIDVGETTTPTQPDNNSQPTNATTDAQKENSAEDNEGEKSNTEEEPKKEENDDEENDENDQQQQPPSALTLVMNAIMSGNPEDIAKALMNDKELLQLESQLRKEDHLMSIEDSLSKLNQYRLQEYALREKVNTFMELFDQFQIRLTDSNQLFKIKQLKVEEITKDIKHLEKNNYDYNIRMNDCKQTTNIINEQLYKIELEKEKVLKIMDKQKLLIERFQNDVNKIEDIIHNHKNNNSSSNNQSNSNNNDNIQK